MTILKENTLEEIRDEIGYKINDEIKKLFENGGYNESASKSMDFHGAFLQVMAMITGKIINELMPEYTKDDLFIYITKMIKSEYSVKDKKSINMTKNVDSNTYIH